MKAIRKKFPLRLNDINNRAPNYNGRTVVGVNDRTKPRNFFSVSRRLCSCLPVGITQPLLPPAASVISSSSMSSKRSTCTSTACVKIRLNASVAMSNVSPVQTHKPRGSRFSSKFSSHWRPEHFFTSYEHLLSDDSCCMA